MKPVCRVLALIVPISLLVPGCPLGCGAYSGGGDVMYRRAGDWVFLCNNGGFTAMVGTGSIEGRYYDTADGVDATNGETGAPAFSLRAAGDGTWSSPELGTGWQEVTLDKTELDHADVQCRDLELHAWWTAKGP